jgi:hypothetical protein
LYDQLTSQVYEVMVVNPFHINAYRPLIKTVFSQLVEHTDLQDLGSKTGMGLCKRVIGVVAAFTMGIYINFVLGRPLLAAKELFA